MGRELQDVYCFIYDENKRFYSATQDATGNYTISSSTNMRPLKFNPSNIKDSAVEFGTNTKYRSLARSVNYPLDFIKDGGAILRQFYHLGKGAEALLYLTIVDWDGSVNYHKVTYNGKFDFQSKSEDPKTGTFSIATVDDSAWGVLSKNDKIQYAIECNETNPKAIRVLLDGITLKNRVTFQPIAAPIIDYNADQFHIIPLVIVNQDGDSAGVILKNQEGGTYGGGNNYMPQLSQNFLETAYALNNVNITGDFTFAWSSDNINQPNADHGGVRIFFTTWENNTEASKTVIFSNINLPTNPSHFNLVPGKIYTASFDFNINLPVGGKYSFVAQINSGARMSITPIVTNIYSTTTTRPQPVVVYALRPLDLLQQLVSKATYGRYTIDSNFFTVNNKSVLTSGDAIRQVPNAKLYTSFEDFFQTFDALDFMALRSIYDKLWMELFDDVYNIKSGVIFNIGEAIDVSLIPAVDFMYNELEIGAPDQDYRHPSGRLEFNSTNTFSLNVMNSDKKLSILTKYRTGCYDITFLILDYQGGSTQDNSGDKSVYVLDISDEMGGAVLDVETFENITIDDAKLAPLIKIPLDNDVITGNTPTISGKAISGKSVNIYIDNIYTGTTTSDAQGFWSYQVLTQLSSYDAVTQTGVHLIQATYTNTFGVTENRNITINTLSTTPTAFLYPNNNDSLYNNIPLIKGVAQPGILVTITIDGVLIGTTAADNSCHWSFQSPLLSNKVHIISCGGETITITVNSFVEHPLITYIDGQLDGDVILNNLPLIKGVATPGTVVSLWIDYITYRRLGTTVADINGNWSYQVVPVYYNDPFSGTPVVLAPIKNGLSIISTSLTNYVVPIQVAGYKLNRPNFTSITGVTDNTVFNVAFSPMRMALNHKSLLSSLLDKTPNEKFYFQKSAKNANLRTVLGTTVVYEHADIPRSALGKPFAMLEYANIKASTNRKFIELLRNFNNGGIIKTSYRGQDLFMLPYGSMKMTNIKDNIQSWKLLISTDTTYQSLLNLYKNGTSIRIMKNSVYHSDYNTLHLVTYNFQDNPKYNFKELYDDWSENRNGAWLENPFYVQKWQKNDVITDQIIVNGVSDLSLVAYRCSDAREIARFPYVVNLQSLISPPDILMEATVNMSMYPNDMYFFVLQAGDVRAAISEKIETREKWDNTILIEASSSLNMVGAFFSTGFKTVLRVEGIVEKRQPDTSAIVTKDDIGKTKLLYGSVSHSRIIRFGTAYGIPDFLYLKIANALAMDNLKIENVDYTLHNDEKIEPADNIDGHPLYYYNIKLDLKDNWKGATFAAGSGADRTGVVLVVDGTAAGLPAGSLINIDLGND